uniref:Uncharacterized protein n=1 Tax=Siphoviridae sp. ctiOl67 TaxID=2825622 RepID=A0A8S5QJM3_9CAUD|nr:MAG TPA: hypothetical protein [Siphoviridae sp. ctiOl67]
MVKLNLTSLNDIGIADMHIGQMIDNYIYLYNVGQYIVLPLYASSISDN